MIDNQENSSMNNNIDFPNWEVIYQECNNHLREQDSKRDQMVAFFMALIGYLLSNDFKTEIYENGKYIMLIILGIIISFVLIRYKRWHEKYVIASQVLGIIMISKEKFEKLNISEKQKELIKLYNFIINREKNIRESKILKILFSVEALIFNSFLLVNLIPVYFLCINILGENNIYTLFFVISSIYILFFNFLIFNDTKNIYKEITGCEELVWILNLYTYNFN